MIRKVQLLKKNSRKISGQRRRIGIRNHKENARKENYKAREGKVASFQESRLEDSRRGSEAEVRECPYSQTGKGKSAGLQPQTIVGSKGLENRLAKRNRRITHSGDLEEGRKQEKQKRKGWTR